MEKQNLKIMKCLWCGKNFEGDIFMYPFCDDCIGKIAEVEEIVRKICGRYINLCKELELKWKQKKF